MAAPISAVSFDEKSKLSDGGADLQSSAAPSGRPRQQSQHDERFGRTVSSPEEILYEGGVSCCLACASSCQPPTGASTPSSHTSIL